MIKFLLELDELCKKHGVVLKYKTGVNSETNFEKRQQANTSTGLSLSSSIYSVEEVHAVTDTRISIEFSKRTKERVR